MKKVFIINVHSFVDIITNSSTELYVIDKKSELVRDFFKAISDDYVIEDSYNLVFYDLLDENEEIWKRDSIIKKLDEKNIKKEDVIIFECKADMPLIKFIDKHFPVIFKEHD